MGEYADECVYDEIGQLPNRKSRRRQDSKLPAPEPLPYVSERALRRVKDALPPPKTCPYCDGMVKLVRNSEIYAGREFGRWPFAYLCAPCNAYVGLHPETNLPLGTLADEETREARKEAKPAFHLLVRKRFGGDLSAAYLWLAERMEIPTSECHFGMFNRKQCGQAIRIIAHAMTGRPQ